MKQLDEIDDEIAELEDVTCGSTGDALTRIRVKLNATRFAFTEETRSRVLSMVYAEAISGDMGQDEFFTKLTELINE